MRWSPRCAEPERLPASASAADLGQAERARIAYLITAYRELRHASHGPAVNIEAEIHALQEKLRVRTAHIFRDLSPWQVS